MNWRGYFLLSNGFRLDVSSLVFIADNQSLFAISATETISIQVVNSLAIYKRLLDLKENSVESVHQTLRALLKHRDAPRDRDIKADLVVSLSDMLDRGQNLIQSLVENLRRTDQPLEDLEQMLACLRICDTLGINGHSLQKLAATDYNELQLGSRALFGAFKAKYEDETQWQDIIEPFQDRLNTMQRDAMCAYIIGREGLNFTDLHDLYNYFLIDVEMSGCERVSRVLAGISSLQLYIHRCRINLEQDDKDPHIVHILPDCIPEDEWSWRKNYRVWEANRKVFVYPENYILPSERDDKSPLFEELENELLQQDITAEAAENAYRKYLTQFSELTRLIIAGSYWHHETNTLYLFGRTNIDPYRYYFRTMKISYSEWTPWQRIDLNINSPHVSAIIHRGKLFLFWVDVNIHKQEKIENNDQKFDYYDYKVNLFYSYLNESLDWIQPQKAVLIEWKDKGGNSFDIDTPSSNPDIKADNRNKYYAILSKTFQKSYPYLDGTRIKILYLRKGSLEDEKLFIKQLDLYKNVLIPDGTVDLLPDTNIIKLLYSDDSPENLLCLGLSPNEHNNEANLDDKLRVSDTDHSEIITRYFLIDKYDPEITIVNNSVPNNKNLFLFRFGEKQLLLGSNPITIRDVFWLFGYHEKEREYPVQLINLSTSLAEELGETLLTDGLDALLSIQTQEIPETPHGIPFRSDWTPWESPAGDHIDFSGAYGLYYWELFFHIPFLIAYHLNATQKYEEAQKWFHYIFDPTTSDPPEPDWPTDRNWRYIKFRKQEVEKLKRILVDQAAIEAYKENPFNAHAIARLRINAYQKTIVMKYIDNLLDWGDHLFAQDTYESINEATMLYILAADILGERPVQMGECETAADEDKTYEAIGPYIEKGSEFLICLENWNPPYHAGRPDDWKPLGGSGKKMPAATAAMDVTKQSVLPFCIPPNETLLMYWDRVADRLFKIRHCMNISGVRRQLALFQPPIDPGLLTRAREAGVSIEDILVDVAAELPPYRFAYLIEKAKSYAGTVQVFGSALLSALEKRDVEELSLLRSVHEQNILNLTTDIRKNRLKESLAQLRALYEAKKNVENREHHYSKLLTDDLSLLERTQQILKHTSTAFYMSEGYLHLIAYVLHLLPNVGSPFAMTYGGKQLGESANTYAEWHRSMATVLDAMASSAGLEATFARRREEWAFQVKLFTQELKQVGEQIIAAEIRQAIAEREVEVHAKYIEQARTLYDFYKGKFTDLGLYTYMATTLGRLHREAYNSALKIAKMAERAYKFERDDETVYIESNWDTGKAGLLSGEKLLIQLQQMEQAYIQNHVRDYEVTQSFSMRQLDPKALLDLKATSACTFNIPEIAFDLFYPGQYRRKIKSVRLTIPCVTGPYINVGCKLILNCHRVRKVPEIEPIPEYCYQSVATSSANNDGGVFELNFQDPRYLPFEGAGAISEWKLEMPAALKPFDYQTISDVIFHISYTAKDNEQYRAEVQDTLRESFITYASGRDPYALDPNHGVFRMFSAKHEFPDSWDHFLHGRNTEGDQELRLPITDNRFPFFVQDETIKVRAVEIFAISNAPIGEEDGLTYTAELTPLGSLTLSSHAAPEPTEMRQKESIYHGHLEPGTDSLWDIGEWRLKLKNDSGPDNYHSLPPDEINDIIMVVHYQIKPER